MLVSYKCRPNDHSKQQAACRLDSLFSKFTLVQKGPAEGGGLCVSSRPLQLILQVLCTTVSIPFLLGRALTNIEKENPKSWLIHGI